MRRYTQKLRRSVALEDLCLLVRHRRTGRPGMRIVAIGSIADRGGQRPSIWHCPNWWNVFKRDGNERIDDFRGVRATCRADQARSTF